MNIGELVNGAQVGDIISIEVNNKWEEYEIVRFTECPGFGYNGYYPDLTIELMKKS